MPKQSIENIRRSLRALNQSYGVFDDKTWEEFGVSYALAQVLFVLDEIAFPIAKHVCEVLQLEKSTLSRFLDKLKKKKLIKFESHAEDARVKVIRLTKKGNELLSRLNAYGDKKTSSALEGLSHEEIKEIESALAKLEKNLNGKRCL